MKFSKRSRWYGKTSLMLRLKFDSDPMLSRTTLTEWAYGQLG
jgi:hypothetical protein